jgi:hypothetical protein
MHAANLLRGEVIDARIVLFVGRETRKISRSDVLE